MEVAREDPLVAASADERPNCGRRAIVFVLPQFSPLIGGAETRALREAKALRARGHDVRVMTLRLNRKLPPTQDVEGVPVQRVGGLYIRGRLRLRFGAQWLAELLLVHHLLRQRNTFDIIHLRQLTWMARPAVIAAILTRKPLLVRLGNTGPEHAAHVAEGCATHLHAGVLDHELPALRVDARSWAGGDFSTLRRAQWLAGLTLRLLRRPRTTWIAISTRMHAYLVEHGVSSERIVVLPNGIDPSDYAAVATRVAARLHEDEPTPAIVVAVSRLSYEKGLDILLHAWTEVTARLPDARLHLVGDGPLRPRLDSVARTLGVSDSVRLLGLVEDVRPFLAEAHSYVHPARWEGMPNALLEAMASGLPCVATRVSGSEDLIVNGASGLLVPPEDPAALSQALLTLLGDTVRARALGMAARERVEHHFNDRELIDRLAALYGVVTAGHRKPQPGARSASTLRTPARRQPTLLCRHVLGGHPGHVRAGRGEHTEV
jgi:glycosyltransferase involved in cell wall biosynthesis